MPFRFSLQALFHLRHSLEHQQELRVRAASHLVERVRQSIAEIELTLEQSHIHQLQELSTGTTAAELRFALSCQAGLGRHRDELETELARRRTIQLEQQKILRIVRRQRETLEDLREHQLREYERTAAKREQRELDEEFLRRRSRARHG